MSSKPIGLTDAKIKGLKAPAAGQVEIKDAVVPGLRLRMGASGAQTFLLRKRVGGAVRNITIGRYSERFGLAEARKKARIVLSDIEAGGEATGGDLLVAREHDQGTRPHMFFLGDYRGRTLRVVIGKGFLGPLEPAIDRAGLGW